jgi:hypothetical protein
MQWRREKPAPLLEIKPPFLSHPACSLTIIATQELNTGFFF